MNDFTQIPHTEEISNKLLINTTPVSRKISLKRLIEDTRNARALRPLSETVVGSTLDRRVHFSAGGTYILLVLPGLLREMHCPDATTVAGLIPYFNAWLHARTEAIDSEVDPSARLAELDVDIAVRGYAKTGQALIALSSSKERHLPVEDVNGDGGQLIIPPTSRVVASFAEQTSNTIDAERIVRIDEVTELANTSGSIARLPTSSVADDVKVGARALLHRARVGSVTLKRASAIKRKSVREENS